MECGRDGYPPQHFSQCLVAKDWCALIEQSSYFTLIEQSLYFSLKLQSFPRFDMLGAMLSDSQIHVAYMTYFHTFKTFMWVLYLALIFFSFSVCLWKEVGYAFLCHPGKVDIFKSLDFYFLPSIPDPAFKQERPSFKKSRLSLIEQNDIWHLIEWSQA